MDFIVTRESHLCEHKYEVGLYVTFSVEVQ